MYENKNPSSPGPTFRKNEQTESNGLERRGRREGPVWRDANGRECVLSGPARRKETKKSTVLPREELEKMSDGERVMKE